MARRYDYPGIDGRPILHDAIPGVRHLANERAGTWRTYCGLDVPDDHRCPSDDEVRSGPPWTMQNCHDCYAAYDTTN